MSFNEKDLGSDKKGMDAYVRHISAADILHPALMANRRMERRVRNADMRCPEVGAIIVFNQTEQEYDTSGRPPLGERGIAKVLSYSAKLIFLQLYTCPNVVTRTSYQISDVKCGLVQYKELTDYVYSSKYLYDDLCLDSLHKDIKKLLKK